MRHKPSKEKAAATMDERQYRQLPEFGQARKKTQREKSVHGINPKNPHNFPLFHVKAPGGDRPLVHGYSLNLCLIPVIKYFKRKSGV